MHIHINRSRRTSMIAVLVAIGAGVAAFAGTCDFQNTRLTTIGGNDTYAGEVVNTSGVNLLDTPVSVAFLDGSGNVVETQQVEPALRSFQDGAVNFFSATSSADSSQTASAIASLPSDPVNVGTTVGSDISLTDVAVTHDTDAGLLHVTGTLTNRDDYVLEAPHVAAVVRDSEGRVVTVASDTGINDLGQDESASFSIDVAVPDSSSTVSSVDLWADGLDGDTPVAPASEIGYGVTDATATPTDTDTPTATMTPAPTDTPVPAMATATP
jgi:hypothetical protein